MGIILETKTLQSMKRYVTMCMALCGCAVSLLTGCSDKELVDDRPLQQAPVVLRATAESRTATRSSLTEKGLFTWIAGDQISVQTTDGDFSLYSFQGETGDVTGDFTPDLTIAVGQYAFSPADLNPNMAEDSTFSVTLPQAYERSMYKSSSKTPSHTPMMGNIVEGSVNFLNLAGVMRLHVRDIPTDGCKIIVTAEDGHQLSGTFSVSGEEVKQIQATTTGVEDDKQVTYTYYDPAQTEKVNQFFFIPLPVSESQKYHVTIYRSATPAEGDKPAFDKNTQGIPVARRSLILMSSLTLPASETATVAEVTSSEGVTNQLTDAANAAESQGGAPVEATLTVTNTDPTAVTVPVEQAIEIPKAITSSETTSENSEEKSSVSITFDQIPVATGSGESTSKAIVITDNQETQSPENPEAPASTESKSEVTIAIPEATEEVDPPSFDISLPTTTVTLAPTSETATYNEVTATTADNTLVVNKGVTINNLYVRSGNVTVKGLVKNLESLSSRTIYVWLEDEGVVQNASGNVVVLRAGEKLYSDFANENVADGMTIPFEIATLEQLMSFSNRVNEGMVERKNKRPYAQCRYVLKNDLNMGDVSEWEAIGLKNIFRGEFDGANHTISANLQTIALPEYCALFGYIENATIQNLTLKGSYKIPQVEMTDYRDQLAASLCGQARNCTFVNCHNQATVEAMIQGPFGSSAWRIGGLVGWAYNSTFTACSNSGALKSNKMWSMGGLCGRIESCTMIACYNKGSMTLTNGETMGGLCGEIDTASLLRGCWVKSSAAVGRPDKYDDLAYIYNDQVYQQKGCFAVEGVPSADEIEQLNQVIIPYGWEYTAAGTVQKHEGNTIPNNPVQPW